MRHHGRCRNEVPVCSIGKARGEEAQGERCGPSLSHDGVGLSAHPRGEATIRVHHKLPACANRFPEQSHVVVAVMGPRGSAEYE